MIMLGLFKFKQLSLLQANAPPYKSVFLLVALSVLRSQKFPIKEGFTRAKGLHLQS